MCRHDETLSPPLAGKASDVAGGLTIFRRVAPALGCVFADYFGLAVIMPVTPFHLRDRCGVVSEAGQQQWAGWISSAQFVGVAVGCLLIGRIADRLGSVRSMRLTILGDVVTFALSAACDVPSALLCVRFLAGLSSPLVPSMLYIFEHVSTAEAVGGSSNYLLAVVLGMVFGGASVGAYSLCGWYGITLGSAALALAALGGTFAPGTAVVHEPPTLEEEEAAAVAPSPKNSPKKTTRGPSSSPRRGAVRSAVCSGHFVTHACTAFNIGFGFTGTLSIVPVVLVTEFGWSPERISLAMLSLSLPNAAAAFAAPTLSRRLGLQGHLTNSVVLQTGASAAAVALAADGYRGREAFGLIAVAAFIEFSVFSQQVSNNSRVKAIGLHLTDGGTGQLTGISRFVFSLGCAAGPAAMLSLHTIRAWAPWAAMLLLQALALSSYPACGISPFRDPLWPRGPRDDSGEQPDSLIDHTIPAV